MRRLVVAVVALVVVGGSIAVALVSAEHRPSKRCPELRLRSSVWTSGFKRHGDGPTERERLASRIVRCDALIGRSRHRVEQLLGRPTEVDGNSLAYLLGPPTAESDGAYLEVSFESGRVARTVVSS